MESMGSLVSIESPCWSNDHFVLCAKCCMIQRFRQKWCTAAVKGNSQIGQLRATTGFPIIYARTCSSFLARFTLVWVGWKPQCCRDSTGLVPQIHLITGLGYHNLVCSCVCECVDVCARMFHQLVFISHSFGAWFWTETQLPDVCCRFFRPVSTQPKRKRLRLMYQSDKEHCTRHIWYSSQLVTSHSIAVITVTRIHSCNPNGLSRK